MTRRDDDRLPDRLLGVWAHPDDEAYLSAGLMARVTDSGGSVTVVTATLGELGFAADDGRSIAERAALREQEMRAAMDAVGVTDVRFLGWPDGGVSDIATATAAARVGEVICDVRPDLVVTFGPDGVTGHPDHVAICAATTRAWTSAGSGRLLYAATSTEWLARYRTVHERLGVWMTGEPAGTDPADLVLDVRLDDAEVERKRRVLAGHASQTDGLAAVMGEDTYREWYRQETFREPTVDELSLCDPRVAA